MSLWVFVQIVINIILGLGAIILWFKLHRPQKDDPRLSRGLQLLQSKISVLEDLSDRTDAQVKQLTSLIDHKARALQNKIVEAEHQVQKVESSMQRSKEVAEIFQDKIPHQEIIERQQTVKYVRAAQLAHAGRSAEDIAEVVDIPLGQAELIAKLNKNELLFDKNALPEWAKVQAENLDGETLQSMALETETANFSVVGSGDLESLFDSPKPELESLKKIGEEFRNACIEFDSTQKPKATYSSVAIRSESLKAQAQVSLSKSNEEAHTVKKVEFPRINLSDNLR